MSVRILVEIEGGVVQSVFCDEDHSVMVIDYDRGTTLDEDGEQCFAEHYHAMANHRKARNWPMLEREEEP